MLIDSQRSHAEITRSASRSVSPDLPSKRRRLRPMSTSPSSLFSGSPPPEPAVPRLERDGYDYRRPVMSTTLNRLSQAPDEGTIDLTGEDSDATTVTLLLNLLRDDMCCRNRPKPDNLMLLPLQEDKNTTITR